MAETVSNSPWSNVSESDYNDSQYARACLLDRGPSAGTAKQRYSLPVRTPDGTLNRNACHAAAAVLAGGRGGVNAPPAAKQAAARKLVALYRGPLGEDPPPSLLAAAGMASASRNADNGGPLSFSRSYDLEDIHLTRSADGRTVEAYAAIFDVEAEIHDGQGHYREVIDRSAFHKTINDARPQGGRNGWRVGVFYNHGRTIHGTPSESGSRPLGVPVDIRATDRGLLTVTRYAKTDLADEVLELIRDGAITAQSFTGRIVRSNPPGRTYRPARNGELPTVRRVELGLTEYGPTPMPAYADAGILSVRTLTPPSSDGAEPFTEPPDDGHSLVEERLARSKELHLL